MKVISKWFFKDFKEDVQNFNYLKSIPFCTFSDLETPRYDLILNILETIKYDKEKFVSIGSKTAPYGISINPDNIEMNNGLLNSCQFSFIFSDKIKESNFLIKSVLAGIVPICNLNHPYIKKLGLNSCATLPDLNNVIDKLSEILDNKQLFYYNIYNLGYKYYRNIQKWK